MKDELAQDQIDAQEKDHLATQAEQESEARIYFEDPEEQKKHCFQSLDTCEIMCRELKLMCPAWKEESNGINSQDR